MSFIRSWDDDIIFTSSFMACRLLYRRTSVLLYRSFKLLTDPPLLLKQRIKMASIATFKVPEVHNEENVSLAIYLSISYVDFKSPLACSHEFC